MGTEREEAQDQSMRQLLHVRYQQALVQTEFPAYITQILGNGVLYVRGREQRPEWSNTYDFEVRYIDQKVHEVYLLSPFITPSLDIHLLQNQEICLYYRPAWSPFRPILVANDLIPMTIRWMQCYEIWQIEKKAWPASWMPHGAHITLERWRRGKV